MSEVKEFSTAVYQQFLEQRKLMGSKCMKCGATFLPLRPICSKCHGTDMELIAMKDKGKLVTYTVIGVGTPMMIEEGFDREHPYCSGLVELEGGVRVLARIVGVNTSEPEKIKIGAPVTVEFQERLHGKEKKTFLAFKIQAEG